MWPTKIAATRRGYFGPQEVTVTTMYRGDVKSNKNGGLYNRGKRYDLLRKQTVAVEYLQMRNEVGGDKIKIAEVARRAKVGWKYAKKVVLEYEESTMIRDPLEEHLELMDNRRGKKHLSIEEEVFLLALRAEDSTRTNLEYIHLLAMNYGRIVSSTFISTWFKNRFQYRGNFKKPNVVPLDKWRPINVSRYLEFKCIMDALPMHHLWCFLDEKHIVNKDAMREKGRADPLTGKMDSIPVSGDFRETYNLIAVVSLNPEKLKSIEYSIDRNNNNAMSFMLFIHYLIETKFFHHNEVLVLDNAAIHVGGVASSLRELLWNSVVDDEPLHVLVLFLPTRSPELNPIELIFHILAKRIRSYRYKTVNTDGRTVVQKTKKILDEIEYDVILKCYLHCGYLGSE